jgi:hypothetical protein
MLESSQLQQGREGWDKICVSHKSKMNDPKTVKISTIEKCCCD